MKTARHALVPLRRRRSGVNLRDVRLALFPSVLPLTRSQSHDRLLTSLRRLPARDDARGQCVPRHPFLLAQVSVAGELEPLSRPLSDRTLCFRGEADAPHRQLGPTHKVLCGCNPDVFFQPFGSSSGGGSRRRPDQRTVQGVRVGMGLVRRRARRAEDRQHMSGRQAAGRQQQTSASELLSVQALDCSSSTSFRVL